MQCYSRQLLLFLHLTVLYLLSTFQFFLSLTSRTCILKFCCEAHHYIKHLTDVGSKTSELIYIIFNKKEVLQKYVFPYEYV